MGILYGKVDTLDQGLFELLLILIRVYQGSNDSVKSRTTVLEWGVMLWLK